MGEATVRVDGAGAGRVNPGAGFPTTATLLCFAVSDEHTLLREELGVAVQP